MQITTLKTVQRKIYKIKNIKSNKVTQKPPLKLKNKKLGTIKSQRI
jgi:hypothetical protein